MLKRVAHQVQFELLWKIEEIILDKRSDVDKVSAISYYMRLWRKGYLHEHCIENSCVRAPTCPDREEQLRAISEGCGRGGA